jgi:hypothetical protein
VLGEAAAVSGRRGHDLLRGEILLEIARVLLLLGDPVGATREARRARRRFVGAGAAGWVGRADVTILSARFARGRGLAPLAAEVDALERMAIAAGDVELQARTVCLAAEIAARRHDPGAGRAALARHPGGDLGLAARLVRAHASVAVSLAAGRPHLAEAILRRSASWLVSSQAGSASDYELPVPCWVPARRRGRAPGGVGRPAGGRHGGVGAVERRRAGAARRQATGRPRAGRAGPVAAHGAAPPPRRPCRAGCSCLEAGGVAAARQAACRGPCVGTDGRQGPSPTLGRRPARPGAWLWPRPVVALRGRRCAVGGGNRGRPPPAPPGGSGVGRPGGGPETPGRRACAPATAARTAPGGGAGLAEFRPPGLAPVPTPLVVVGVRDRGLPGHASRCAVRSVAVRCQVGRPQTLVGRHRVAVLGAVWPTTPWSWRRRQRPGPASPA